MRTSPCLCAFISGGSAREANPVCIYEFWRGGKKSAKTEVWQALYLSLRDSLPVHLYLYYTHISAVFSLSFIRAGTHTDIPRSAYGSTGSPAHRTNQSHTRWRTPTSPLCPLGRRCSPPPLAAALPTATPLTHRSRSDTYVHEQGLPRSQPPAAPDQDQATRAVHLAFNRPLGCACSGRCGNVRPLFLLVGLVEPCRHERLDASRKHERCTCSH